MRGPVAEQRDGANTSRASNSRMDGGAAGSRGAGGYNMKPGSQGERADGRVWRSSNSRWEVRLGTLQVAVWLGLAVGACVGGYFVGFFSGRYVGFESARQSSSGEEPKLPAPEMFADASALNPNRVYEKLRAPAILPDSGGPRASAKVSDVVLPPSNSERARDIDAINEAKGAFQRQQQKPSGQSADQVGGSGDDIFDEVQHTDRLIIGSDEGLTEELEEKLPSSVRMLGNSDRAVGDGGTANAKLNKGDASSAAAVLDARIASARSEVARAAPQAVSDSQESKKPAPDSATKTTESAGLVRKVLPSGYFAQVAAPKKLAEAEGVAKRLKRSGFPVLVESASVNGQSFYRVLVGPEENKVQAERLVSQLQSESYVASKPFIRKVK
jgi:cell division septation protein DedD